MKPSIEFTGARYRRGVWVAAALAVGTLAPHRASAAEFGPTCRAFIATIAKTNNMPVPGDAELAKQCECIAGKLSDDDKEKAVTGLDRIVEAGKTGKASSEPFTDDQKDAMKKFGEVNASCP